MASAVVSSPGTEYGPCVDPCPHRDCAMQRSIASMVCPICLERIGYEVRYYADEFDGYCHAVCAEEAVAP